MIALIGIVEYGVQKLPHTQKTQYTNPQDLISSIFHKRQAQTTPTVTGQPNPNAFVPTTILSPSPPGVVIVTTPVPPPTGTATGPDGGYIPTILPTSSAPDGGYIPTTITAPTSTGADGGYIPTIIAPTSVGPDGGYIPTTVGSAPDGGYIPTTIQTTINGKATTITTGKTSKTDGYSTIFRSTSTSVTLSSTFVTSIHQTSIFTGANGQVSTSTTVIASTMTGTSVVATEVPILAEIPPFAFGSLVLANYVPLIVSVLVVQFWTAIYSQAKLIEPFVRLNTEVGVAANSVLDAFYLSSYLTPDPILAIIRKHWLILWTSLVYFVIGLLGPLASEFLFLDTNYPDCPILRLGPANMNPCWPPRLSIDPGIARGIEGLLTFAAVMCLSLAVMIMRTRSGIYSDPSSIASITSLVHHPEVVNDFRSFSAEASMKEVREFLKGKFYKLGDYQRQDGVWRYGIVPTVPTVQQSMSEKPPVTQKPRYRRWRILDLIADVIFGLVILALLGIVAGYYKDAKNDPFNNFFNSGKFGPSFALTATGSLMAMNWKRIERGKLRDSNTI
jgi:hypothetical protein